MHGVRLPRGGIDAVDRNARAPGARRGKIRRRVIDQPPRVRRNFDALDRLSSAHTDSRRSRTSARRARSSALSRHAAIAAHATSAVIVLTSHVASATSSRSLERAPALSHALTPPALDASCHSCQIDNAIARCAPSLSPRRNTARAATARIPPRRVVRAPRPPEWCAGCRALWNLPSCFATDVADAPRSHPAHREGRRTAALE